RLGEVGLERGGLVRQAFEVAAQLSRDGQDAQFALAGGKAGAEADLGADLLHRVPDLGGQQHDGERAREAPRLVDDRHGARLAGAGAAGDRLVNRALRGVEVRRGAQVEPGRRVLEYGSLACLRLSAHVGATSASSPALAEARRGAARSLTPLV